MLLHQYLYQVAHQVPEKKAVICGEKGLTYRQLVEKMDAWAAWLMGCGVRRGDRVGLMMYNGLDLVQFYYACFRLGAIAVPFNTRYQEPELAYAVNQSGSSILLAGREFTPVVQNIRKDAPGLGGLFMVDDPLEEVFANPGLRREAAIPEFPEVEITDPAVIIYTSGSTGKPKGVIHTHYSLSHHIDNKTKSLEIDADTVGLIGTQICHCAGFAGILLPVLAHGGTCVMLKEFESGAYIAHLQKYQPTLLILMPTQLLEVLEHSRAQDADFSRTSSMLIGGDKVPHHIYELFRAQAGFDLSEGCGMTECEGYCVQPHHEPKKPGSIGKPIAGVTMRLADADGNELPDNQAGEIQLQAESVTTGYWDNEAETARALVNGWFRTGDLAFRDADGYYHFVGRIKEIIIRGGSNIMPGEVEDVLDDHPQVELSGVVGFPDAHYGSIVGAFIIPKDPVKPPTPEELHDFASKRLARYKLPEKWIFVAHLPQTASGKIDRKQLHVLAAAYAKKEE
ncbi:MAG: class I adenylate-forming enzyme family protein [Thermodesulfobacteriota bacterium]